MDLPNFAWLFDCKLFIWMFWLLLIVYLLLWKVLQSSLRRLIYNIMCVTCRKKNASIFFYYLRKSVRLFSIYVYIWNLQVEILLLRINLVRSRSHTVTCEAAFEQSNSIIPCNPWAFIFSSFLCDASHDLILIRFPFL